MPGALFVFLLSAAGALAADLLLPAPGPHAPGYRAVMLEDRQRAYGESRRPILAAVWYPAQPVAPAGFPYREYLRLPASRAAGFSEKVAEHTERRATRTFPPLLDSFTNGCRDCPPAGGRFPVLLYHPGTGGSFEENSALFEYLASRGFVVISSAFQSREPEFITADRTDPSDSLRDLSRLFAYAATLPYADPNRTAAMGHSLGAQRVLEWIGQRDCPVKAAVSLDAMLEYSSEVSPQYAALRRRLEGYRPPRIPVMLFADLKLRPNFGALDTYLKQAPRLNVAVRSLSHGDFLSQSAIRLPEKMRQPYGDVARTIEEFLRCALRDEKLERSGIRSTAHKRVKLVRPKG